MSLYIKGLVFTFTSIFIVIIFCKLVLVDVLTLYNDVHGDSLENNELNFHKLLNKYSPIRSQLSEDGKLNFTELAKKYGQRCDEYDVTTEDGYILKLFHIPGRGRSVLLMHGILDTSNTFIIRGNTSLAITLAEAGYDVWAGNFRGNRYSQGHVTLDPKVDKEYWDFSLYEFGYYDYSAIIDFVLHNTRKKKITAISHSQGTANFFVLNSLRPNYNNKIDVFIALAPIAFLNHLKGITNLIIKLAPAILWVLTALGIEELFNVNSSVKRFIETACTQKFGSYKLCFDAAIFQGAGFDSEEMDPEFSHILFGHYPAENSVKNLYHVSQIANNKRFADFDYGADKNIVKYGTSTPPEFDLTKVTAKVALLIGANDFLSVIKDVEILRSLLPNVVKHQILPREKFNHLDFVWGKNMPKHLYPHIFDILDNLIVTT